MVTEIYYRLHRVRVFPLKTNQGTDILSGIKLFSTGLLYFMKENSQQISTKQKILFTSKECVSFQ